MKRLTILSVLLFVANFLFAQENIKGDIVVGFSLGPSLANFMSSEAPNKINIFGSDIQPLLIATNSIEESLAYPDYQTSIFKDNLTGISIGMQIEYFLKQNLSIQSGICYETNGINLKYSDRRDRTQPSGSWEDETFNIKIVNNYLTIPVLLRKYLFKNQKAFIDGGLYTGYLVSSNVTFLKKKIVSDETGVLSQSILGFDNQKDTKKEYTNKFDFGFSAGAGYINNLSDKLIFKTEMLLNVGIIKVDSKYNNEYTVTPTASGGSFGNSLVRATNYYGLNSNSKNINLMLTLGLGYKIGK